MADILAFPATTRRAALPDSFFSEEEVRAYVERNAGLNPDRVQDLKLKLQLATKAAGLLQNLIDGIRLDLDLDSAERN